MDYKIIKTLKKNLLIKQDLKETNLELELNETWNNKQESGVIVGISDNIKNNLSLGDRVFFGKYSGVNVSYGKEKFILLEFREVIGVMKEKIKLDILDDNTYEMIIKEMDKSFLRK
jgi:co-chaperonin GroES (HSP10)